RHDLGKLRFRLLPLAVLQALEANPPPGVETGRLALLVEIAGVLAPVGRRFIPGHPEPAVIVTCEADVGAEQAAAGRQDDLATLRLRAARQAANPHVVVAVVVGVPADPDTVFLRIMGDSRVPVVAFAFGDLDRVVPTFSVRAAGVDVALAVFEALPD